MKVCIIGGSGKIGQQLIAFFSRHHVEAIPVGRKTTNFQEILESSDVIFFSVPIFAVKQTVEKIQSYQLEGKVIINLASNMQEGYDVLKELPCAVCCLHALCGPDLSSFEKQNIIVAPQMRNSYIETIVSFFENEGAIVSYTAPFDHDAKMGVTQALSQFSSIVFGKTVAELHIPKDELSLYTTLTFRLNSQTIKRICTQDSELWANIQFYNDAFAEYLSVYRKNMETLSAIVSQKDMDAFDRYYQPIQSYWREKEKKSAVSKTKQNVPYNALAALGPKGTYSEQAAVVYDASQKRILCDSILEVLDFVSNEKVALGIVPFENSIHGTILQTIDTIYVRKLHVIKEVVLSIQHCVAGVGKVCDTDAIKKVYSHPQALAQCEGYIRKTYPNAVSVPLASTAEAFFHVKEQGTEDCVAIGSVFGAKEAGLHVYEESVQDVKNNKTAFLVVQKKEPEKNTTATKTFLALSPQVDSPGLLYRLLSVTSSRGVNLSKIESRPSRRQLGTYLFYVVLDTADEKLLSEICADFESENVVVSTLGQYDRVSDEL